MTVALSISIINPEIRIAYSAGAHEPMIHLGNDYLFFDTESWQRFVLQVQLFESARLGELEMSHDPQSPTDAADLEDDDNVEYDFALCEECEARMFKVIAKAAEQSDIDGRWLCEEHLEEEAQRTAEREADEAD